jgi:predicted transposase YbfD/YdcC
MEATVVNPTNAGLGAHFADLEDPRIDRTKLHRLIDIVVIAICGVICGAETWNDIAEWGKTKEEWLRGFLELPNGIPSHDTFRRVFSLLDAQQFEACFVRWMQSACRITGGQVIAIDGKTLRRSHDRANGKAAIHMVSAWAAANRVVLAQTKVDDKSNEITAVPELLKVLEVAGCIVTLDALGCQKEFAHLIRARGADYVLAVKENQGHLYEDIKDLFDTEFEQAIPFGGIIHDYAKTTEKDHGRIETRRCWTISDPEYLKYLRDGDAWEGLATIAIVRAERRLADDRCEIEDRFYISSLPGNAAVVLNATRSHWGIENCVHWVLDVIFHEDDSRMRKGNSPRNFAILRRIALNLIRHEQSCKRSIKGKRLKAGWSDDYLLAVLKGLGN